MKLPIHNSFTHSLPKDPDTANIPRGVLNAAYSEVTPIKTPHGRLLHYSADLAKEMGLSSNDIEELSEVLRGNIVYPGTAPYAMGYAGHQFGHWAGQLGDGRAINLFQTTHKAALKTWQLKGAGPTPYSRKGDGFAVLRSSIREHLCSEAMHYLGVPTTRSLALSLSGEQVLRDIMYDGNPSHEPGAIVCRIDDNFIRFGHFEYFAAQDHDLLKKFTDYVISEHFKEISGTDKNAYLAFFQTVVDSTLQMVIHWQRVGFVHGVMNTDNMSIMGHTIDYGPYGWLEPYDHHWTPNTTDRENRRYRYGAQPEIALWNLLQLANALFSLIKDSPALEAILNDYKTNYQLRHLEMMRCKLGLLQPQENDQYLVSKLMKTMHLHPVDMTIFFRELSKVSVGQTTTQIWDLLKGAFYELEDIEQEHIQQWHHWLELYQHRISTENPSPRVELMLKTNPKYVFRNYMAQLAIESAENGDYSLIKEFHELLKKPYNEQPEMLKWYAKRPEWAQNKVGCSMLSCSS